MALRKYCSTCNAEFDTDTEHTEDTADDHTGHDVKMYHNDTLLLLGWGHLEAKLQSCFIQVLFKSQPNLSTTLLEARILLFIIY